MKLITKVTAAFSLVQSANGFVTKSKTTKSSTTLSVSDFLERSLDEPIPEEASCLNTLRRQRFSKAIPFLERPALLDGKYPGDVGFDPLGFAKTEEDLTKYREAEVKHGRLAMLAAVGWPLSEVFDDKIASTLNLPSALDSAGRAPSILNNFEGISANYWFVIITFAAIIDSYGLYRSMRKDDTDYFPGNLGFDPLGFYASDETEQRVMQLMEIKHGRTAMMAVVVYGIQEFASDSSIVPSF
jgi:hypothetical protein